MNRLLLKSINLDINIWKKTLKPKNLGLKEKLILKKNDNK